MMGQMLLEQVDLAAVQVLHSAAAHAADVQVTFPAAVELIMGRFAAFLRGVTAQLPAFTQAGNGAVHGGLADGQPFPAQLFFQLLIGFLRLTANQGC